MAHLEVEGICKGWEFPVIDELSFAVEEGEFFVVLGPSGIGKTTTLRLISGLETPDAGRILIGGTDQTRLPPYRRRIAMTFESYALYPHLSVYENIASPLRARRLPANERDKRVKDVAELLRIAHLLDRRPGEVSGGQKQRTALGRTLVADPEVFLLDEPISHLDAKIRHELRTQFHTLEDLRKVATVYVTHDYAEALSLGDRIGVMGTRGRLEQVGNPRDLFERPANLKVAEHLGQPTINVIPSRIRRDNNGLFLDSETGDLRLKLSGESEAALAGYSKDHVIAGLRPQYIRPIDEAADGMELLSAEVDVYEPLGTNGIMMANLGSMSLTALTDPEKHYETGQKVQIAVDVSGLHLFDADSQVRLTGIT
ncbi:MAG: ABC transporter ATP-binding protein [Rhodobacteraceae bacterium]|nr:ABC transporter ATP-binding protein [Paracoccaceae bacterium]